MSVREKLGTLPKDVQKLRKENKQWAAIAEELEISPGKAMLAYEFAVVEKGDLITGTDAAVAKAIVKARDVEKVSWAVISARTDLPESRCRSIYEGVKGEGTTRGNRIGKGGRFPSDEDRPAKTKTEKAPPKGKVAAKKTTGTKVEAKKVPIQKMNKAQISARLTGKVIGVQNGEDEKVRSMKVAEVVSLSKAGGSLVFKDGKGTEHSVDVNDIVRASA